MGLAIAGLCLEDCHERRPLALCLAETPRRWFSSRETMHLRYAGSRGAPALAPASDAAVPLSLPLAGFAGRPGEAGATIRVTVRVGGLWWRGFYGRYGRASPPAGEPYCREVESALSGFALGFDWPGRHALVLSDLAGSSCLGTLGLDLARREDEPGEERAPTLAASFYRSVTLYRFLAGLNASRRAELEALFLSVCQGAVAAPVLDDWSLRQGLADRQAINHLVWQPSVQSLAEQIAKGS